MRPRIAFGGFHTECSTWSPVLVRAEDFRQLRGEALLAHPEFAVLGGFAAEWVPTVHWRSVPGGPVAREAYEGFKAEFLARLAAALPIDGLYLAMHGAAFVEGMNDAEGDFVAAARALVGPECPISASYDLHGNVSQAVIDALDMFAGYRTAPHIDVDETKARACGMLVAAIGSGTRPFLAWARVPVLLPGERTSTVEEPAKGLYGRLAGWDAVAGISDANLMVGYVWADEPRGTACAVVTGTERGAMARAVGELAGAYWEARGDFRFGPVTAGLEECLDIAARCATRPLVLSDSGDNPTAGGAADSAAVLGAVLARGFEEVIVAGIADLPAVAACYAVGVGARLTLSIGATLHPAGSVPVVAAAEVVHLAGAEGAERQAVVRVRGVTVILAARRRPYYNRSDYTDLGIDPAECRMLVVKLGYLMPDLAAIANPALMALTTGVVDQDIPRLPVRHVTRPCFPWDTDFAYVPEVIFSARAP